ncbi:MAG: hypothetical protein WD397_12745 [Wenzhouxiangellaceae bacterium]
MAKADSGIVAMRAVPTANKKVFENLFLIMLYLGGLLCGFGLFCLLSRPVVARWLDADWPTNPMSLCDTCQGKHAFMTTGLSFDGGHLFG